MVRLSLLTLLVALAPVAGSLFLLHAQAADAPAPADVAAREADASREACAADAVSTAATAPNAAAPAVITDPMTEDELEAFNGQVAGRPILLALSGVVYDVSDGPYKPSDT